MNPKIVLVCRILLGLIFLIFGSNGLLMFTTGKGFIPAPPPTGQMLTVFNGFMATGYMMIMVKGLQVLSAILLLANKYVNAALTILGPIVVNILLIHLFAAPEGLPIAIVVFALWSVLVYSRWHDFKVLLKA